MPSKIKRKTLFNFEPGRILSRKYEIISLLGVGWEGEVYRVKEIDTGIERAAKFFFPKRNVRNKALKMHVKKSHALRHCRILVQYNTIEKIHFQREEISYLISELVEGPLLSQYIEGRPGKRILAFEGLHLLYGLSSGVSPIHHAGHHHGDLHLDNLILTRKGLEYEFKAFDFFHHTGQKSEGIFTDVLHMIDVLFEALGGPKCYARQPQYIKDIICGRKQNLIRKKFKNATQLKVYLQNLNILA
ncbi:MAG: hypothetical protein KDD52_01105 [Bdellovibrionales bacterium]|nr:hypothetical protein [Bdellovibrionales bacterium]